MHLPALQDVLPNWPDKRLHIMAEHSTVFTDLFAEPRVQQTLNPEGPHARAFKYFRCDPQSVRQQGFQDSRKDWQCCAGMCMEFRVQGQN
jgi:hypothetical protein